MGWLLSLITGELGPILLGILAAVAAWFFGQRKGRKDQKRKHRIKDLETANDIRERGANARREYDGSASRDELVGRLRNRGRFRDE